MAGRLPFNLPNYGSGQNPFNDPQIRAALRLGSIDETRLLEAQREFHLTQRLLQGQLGQMDPQSRLDSMVVEQRLKQLREQLQEHPELQQNFSQLLRGQDQSTLFARSQLQNHFSQSQVQSLLQGAQKNAQPNQVPGPANQASSEEASPTATVASGSQAMLRDIAADSLAGNAVKRSEIVKRVFASPDGAGAGEAPAPVPKKRARPGTEDSGDCKKKRKRSPKNKSANEGSSSNQHHGRPNKHSAATTFPKSSTAHQQPTAQKPSAQALLDFASNNNAATLPNSAAPRIDPVDTLPKSAFKKLPAHHVETDTSHGTVKDLLHAAESEDKVEKAASALSDIKSKLVAEWSESEAEGSVADVEDALESQAVERGDVIDLPNFKSVLPQLPEEPEAAVSNIPKKKKRSSLLDGNSTDGSAASKSAEETEDAKKLDKDTNATESAYANHQTPNLDPWWPSIAAIRKEKKINGEPFDEDNFVDDRGVLNPESPFRANLPRIRERLLQEVTPGVLEKLPHCIIHRKRYGRSNSSGAMPQEFVHCFQVTELYPNDMMVCCSHCGTWRHAACGGHHRPYSIRECIDAPFNAICDRCHAEEKILRDHPAAKKRIDKQRSEQIRRGLATSATMRQASFSKHGGTYKWPLGSVSATHIGGHTRSVHHRHDKAEKQWEDMAQRLSKNYGNKDKERVKARTKELEKLLASVEDAEGHTDRHNMMLFLLQDTLREIPIGFELPRRNLFDPAEDDGSTEKDEDSDIAEGTQLVTNVVSKYSDPENAKMESIQSREPLVCVRKSCTNRSRFDSVFCSDACGVACLEGDLLRTFHYTSDMHPSVLRN